MYALLAAFIHPLGCFCPRTLFSNSGLDNLPWTSFVYQIYLLTLKHRETHGCVVSTVATDALVLKHQAISIHNAD